MNNEIIIKDKKKQANHIKISKVYVAEILGNENNIYIYNFIMI